MNKYYFIFLIWLLPVYFLAQFGYQALTFVGIQTTFNKGDSYVATVIDFDVKQIAAQTNGYVVLNFTKTDGEVIEERLALPVQFAQVIMNSELIPVRYSERSFSPIVMMPVYDLQKNVIKVNIAVTLFGVIAGIIGSFYASRYARRRIRDGEEELQVEIIDDAAPAAG